MVTKYCDHGVYGAYAATPTWGTPQEGDGTLSTASASAATISLDCSGYTFVSGSSTISIMGATAITMTGSATSGTNAQYSATLTTMLDNIASAINQCTATIVNKPTGWIAAQVRNAVFARRNGNSLEIMTRTGSASWNTLIGITWANVTGSSSGSWANGAGGCWGWLFNHSTTIWASAIALAGYGVWGTALPHAGTIGAGDVVKIRANKTITTPANTSIAWTLAALGTALAPVLFEIDDGTEWPADGSTPVLNITTAVTNTYPMSFAAAAACHAHIKGKIYGSGARNFVMEITGNSASAYAGIKIYSGADIIFENAEFSCPATNTYPTVIQSGFSGNPSAITTLKNCKLAWSGVNTAICFSASGWNGKVTYSGCEFVVTGATTASTGLFQQPTGQLTQLVLDGCKFSGFVTGSRLFATIGTLYGDIAYRVNNCDLGNVTVWGPANLSAAIAGADYGEATRGMLLSSQYGSRGYAVDIYGRSFTEWNPAKGRPYLNAVLHDGVTPWQLYMVPSITSGNVSRLSPVEFPQIRKLMPAAGDLAEAARTITLNFLLESTLSAWTKQDVSVLCKYLDTGGNIVVVDTYDPAAGALTSSSAAWSTTSWNGQTWLKREITLTTPTAVESESEVSFVVRIHSHVANDTIGIIIDPELLVS